MFVYLNLDYTLYGFVFLNFSIGTFSNFSENFKRPSSLKTNLHTATAIIQGSKNDQYRLVCHMSFEPRVFPVFMIFSRRMRCCMEWHRLVHDT